MFAIGCRDGRKGGWVVVRELCRGVVVLVVCDFGENLPKILEMVNYLTSILFFGCVGFRLLWEVPLSRFSPVWLERRFS